MISLERKRNAFVIPSRSFLTVSSSIYVQRKKCNGNHICYNYHHFLTDISLNGIPLTETIKLPNVGYVETSVYNAFIYDNENDIYIIFDSESAIYKVKEDECNIGLCKTDILGIEIIASTNIWNKEVIKPIILEDIPLTMIKPEK